MWPGLVRRVVFPLHERLKGKPTYARLRDLERTQWLPAAAICEQQLDRIREHLDFAYREVPYYTRLLDEHEAQPRRIHDFADFARIPFLTKDIIRTRAAELTPRRRLRGVQRLSTGGSTGAPVTVLVDPERAAFTDATRLRAHRWYNADVGAREVVLWGSPIETGRQDLVRATRDRLINSRLLSAFDMGPASLARYADVVRRDRPVKLYGYASSLYLLALHLGRERWTAGPGWPKVVFTTAEPLYDFQRAAIEAVFRCPVSVEYGARDAGLVANQCPSGGLHIAAEGMVVEMGDTPPGGAPGTGEIVVTNLHSLAMPIIRYRTGDVGALDGRSCACGRGLPLLGSVEGRQTDFLVTPDGRIVHALGAIYVLRELPDVREFQIVQDRADRVRVVVVSDGPLSRSSADAIPARLARVLPGVAIDLEEAAAIARPAGKHRYVISAAAAEHLGALSGAVR